MRVHRLPVSGNEARGIARRARSRSSRLIDRVAPDLVFNYAAQTWATDCCFELLERAQRPRMVLAPCGFSGLGKRLYASYFAAMPDRLRSYDALILHSTVYQDWSSRPAPALERIFVLPNGADRRHRRSEALRARRPAAHSP